MEECLSPPFSTFLPNLTELFTLVYVFVDDYLLAAQRAGLCELPKSHNQKGSYSELMTIGLVGELLKQRYSGDWFEFVKSEYRALFPELPATFPTCPTWN